MANIPEYSSIVNHWEDIREDIPEFLANPYTWLEKQMNIACKNPSQTNDNNQLETLLDIMHTLNSIHFHIHDEHE